MEYSAVYKNNSKLIDKLDPRTKLAWYGIMIYLALTRHAPLHLGIILILGITSILILSGSLKHYKTVVFLMLLLGLQILILQLLFCREGTLLYQWGILKVYSEAVPLAITGTLKSSIIVLASIQFLTSATATDFTLMLIKFRIPYRFAMLVGLGARFLPLMKSEYQAIIESQSTRGLKMESVWDNIKSILPTSLPFLFRAVRRATETALAMELRGFGRNNTRTFAYDLSMKKRDTLLIISMLLFITLDLAWKVIISLR